VGCQRRLDLGSFEKLGRSAACDRLEPAQLGQREDRGRFPATVDHLIPLARVRITGRPPGHAATVAARPTTAMPPLVQRSA
jgi:hypothetical protein